MAEEMSSSKLNVQCTFAGCTKYFETEKLMRRHKEEDPDHHYCKKCKLDFEDWEALKTHKVLEMIPWLEGRKGHNEHESPKHIVCEFCSEDFKSFKGREIHRENNHKAEQNVKCEGCKETFRSAGSYIEHIERGLCKKISRVMFQRSVQHKHVNNEVMKDPVLVQQIFAANELQGPHTDTPGLIEDRAAAARTEEGGVSLLDQEDEGQSGGYKPLEAEVNLIDMKETAPLTRRNLETWPRLPGQEPPQLTESMHSMALTSPTPSISGTEISASEYASGITSRRGGYKIYTESYPSLSSPQSVAFDRDDDDTSSVATTIAASSINHSTAWTTGSTSRALFPSAKPTAAAGDWKGILKHLEQEATPSESTNLFRSRWWDPHHTDFAVEKFFNPVIGKFLCPFPGCGDSYDVPSDIAGHLQYTHVKTSYRCPLCLKLFKSAHALVSHSESSNKCKVRNSTMYHKLLNEITGGYLEAKHVKQPKVYKTDNALVKGGERVDGLMDMKFEAKLPEGEEEELKEGYVMVGRKEA